MQQDFLCIFKFSYGNKYVVKEYMDKFGVYVQIMHFLCQKGWIRT